MGTYRNFWPIGGALIGLSGDAYLRGGGGLLEDLRLHIAHKGPTL